MIQLPSVEGSTNPTSRLWCVQSLARSASDRSSARRDDEASTPRRNHASRDDARCDLRRSRRCARSWRRRAVVDASSTRCIIQTPNPHSTTHERRRASNAVHPIVHARRRVDVGRTRSFRKHPKLGAREKRRVVISTTTSSHRARSTETRALKSRATSDARIDARVNMINIFTLARETTRSAATRGRCGRHRIRDRVRRELSSRARSRRARRARRRFVVIEPP